ALLQQARDGHETRVKIGLARIGKASRQRAMRRLDACLTERCEQPTIIFVAAALGRELARDCEDQSRHPATSPSKQARATCDSWSVTRMREMPSPPGPSAPERAAAAI